MHVSGRMGWDAAEQWGSCWCVQSRPCAADALLRGDGRGCELLRWALFRWQADCRTPVVPALFEQKHVCVWQFFPRIWLIFLGSVTWGPFMGDS
jgi:hypothetical protein